MTANSPLKKLALAGAMGALMSVSGLASAHVTYNLAAGDTFPPDGSATGPWSDGDPGYIGNLPATWVAMIHNDGGVANSQTASGHGIGMGAKAYKDGATNWGHTADYGLFELHADAEVTITVSSDGSNLRPAFGLWSGWDTAGSSSRHQSYLNNGALNPMAASPLGTTLALVDASAWTFAATQGTTATATLTRFLTAGNYTLILGGYDGTVGGANLAYTATISAAASPVPVPGAVWLFGSAMAGLVGFGKRKTAENV
ncbi:hypothetical protein [Methylomonas sp. MK1]|uniref:hypothetical protein n=1 Tax=Methylomonas sp. MK1 TaxID=1131552 RepID=UPI0012683486|nr:hypothetical protein [Methylomonas sp. MK1]